MFRVVALWWGVWLLTLLAPHIVQAQEANRAGLVIVHSDGAATSRCVEFTGDSISGYDLLVQTGLDLNVEASGMGASICRLDGEGCTAPRESCFCQCQGGSECLYWSYWQRADGAWRYSNQGAGIHRVNDGAVEGWVWGDGQAQSSALLPELTFADICPAETGVAPVAASSELTAAAVSPATAPTAVSTTNTSAQVKTGVGADPVTFLLVLVPLSVLGAAYWLRRKGAR